MQCSKSKPEAEEKGVAAGGESADNANAGRPTVIVVLGATGQQGGSVIRAMKDDNNFVLKAATRNPDSDKAKQLALQGNALLLV